MRIGLLGFGTIGRGVYDLARIRADMTVARVLCRRDLTLADAAVTHDYNDILRDKTIDTVVETMGGLHPAYEYVRDAILVGKNVITVNKALVAAYYDELIPLAKKQGVLFRCSAAVGGGIPWLSTLERVRRLEEVERVDGIMNGTCNYILDSMTRLGLSYSDALRQAQELGYAEADPSADVDGIDTWNKLIISTNVAFGVSVEREGVPAAGISHIRAVDVETFTAHGVVCKLIASASHHDSHVSAYVQPTLCPLGQPEAAVPANFNLISLYGEVSGRKSFFGQGAGRYPTANNVIQDCVDMLENRGFYCAYGHKVPVINDVALRWYVRGASDAWLTERTVSDWGTGVVTRPISVNKMHAWLKNHPDCFAAAFMA